MKLNFKFSSDYSSVELSFLDQQRNLFDFCYRISDARMIFFCDIQCRGLLLKASQVI